MALKSKWPRSVARVLRASKQCKQVMAHQVLPLLVGLLVTYCYRLPPIIAIPDKKDVAGTEEEWPLVRSYRLEDFLWTGSGDGQDWRASSPWLTTTVVRTTTVLATVLAPTPGPDYPLTSPTCCAPPPSLIRPTASWGPATPTVPPWRLPADPVPVPDHRYWLITVLRLNVSQPVPAVGELENRLARLYKAAFARQQERHLGIGNATAAVQRQRRARDRRVPEPISVQLHNQSAHEAGRLSLLYTVRVAGRPVMAHTAAADMRLVSAGEMAAELGHPILTKAEPYLKEASPWDGGWRRARARDTWLLVGSAAAALLLLLLLALVLALSLGKRKRGKRRVLASSGLQRGTANLAYRDDEPPPSKVADMPGGSSPGFHAVSPRDEGAAVVVGAERKGSSGSECSDTSLVRRRPSHASQGPSAPRRTIQLPQPRKRLSTTRATQQTQAARKRSQSPVPTPVAESRPTTCEEPLVPTVGTTAVSPNSFLSMPSIKAFPRGANIPEPLVRVLEPVSVQRLEPEEGVVVEPVPRRVAIHGSLEGQDPGVVGPLVWELHRQRLVHCTQPSREPVVDTLILDVEEAVEEECGAQAGVPGVGRVRQRFQELLDDAFSLFGSRSDSLDDDDEATPPVLQRVRSAIVRPDGEPLPGSRDCAPRPHTCSHQRPATANVSRPRGAWGSAQASPPTGQLGTLPRPLSAGPFHRPQLPGPAAPVVDRTLVLSEERLAPADPAVPLIAAIKEELRRFQGAPALPGSTSRT